MKRHLKTSLAALAIVLGAGVGVTLAARAAGGENDAVATLAQAHVGLTQAVDIALAQTAGRATRAELGDENGHAIYEIEVVAANNQVFDMKVDAVAGKLLSSQADKADQGRDEKDGNED
ncbi:MAG: hypothetical protein ABT20_16785 [Rubrivivax sp. SCN 70-15]|nr:MAG: hypothetical protein ABT20_16785 [Rubrivivax sp. SCN 70-15]